MGTLLKAQGLETQNKTESWELSNRPVVVLYDLFNEEKKSNLNTKKAYIFKSF